MCKYVYTLNFCKIEQNQTYLYILPRIVERIFAIREMTRRSFVVARWIIAVQIAISDTRNTIASSICKQSLICIWCSACWKPLEHLCRWYRVYIYKSIQLPVYIFFAVEIEIYLRQMEKNKKHEQIFSHRYLIGWLSYTINLALDARTYASNVKKERNFQT